MTTAIETIKTDALNEITNQLKEFDVVEAGIATLEQSYKGVLYEVATAKGMADAKAARAAVREPRVLCEKMRKAIKGPVIDLGRQIDARAEKITSRLVAIEEPIDQQIKAEEERKEAERAAKAKAEQDRVEAIQKRIDAIRAWPQNASTKPSSLVEQMLADANAYALADFAEFTQVAELALNASRAALVGILAERKAYEAEQVKLEADRAELAKLRAEALEREKAESARRAAEEAEAKRIRDEEAARQAAELEKQKAEQARIAAERQAELDRQAREQEERARAQREANEAEERRLAQQRAELQRQQEEQRRREQAAEALRAEQARIAAVARPTDDELIAVIAEHYRVPTAKVIEWLPIVSGVA